MKDWLDCDLLDLLHGGASAGPLSQDPEVIYRRAQCAALARLLERIPEGTTARAKPTLEAVGSALQTTLEDARDVWLAPDTLSLPLVPCPCCGNEHREERAWSARSASVRSHQLCCSCGFATSDCESKVEAGDQWRRLRQAPRP